MSISAEDKRLITVFAQQQVSDVAEIDIRRAFGMREMAEVQNQPNYHGAFQRVRAAKLIIERITNGYTGYEDQALQCLAQLNEDRESSIHITDNFQVTEALIEQSCYQHWPDNIQQEYQRRCHVIGHWHNVFISYTNRDACTTNQRYKDLILFEWGEAINPASEASNYIARTLAKYLEQADIHGFIDYKKLQCGDDIEDSIRQHSGNAITLLQLLEPEIFKQPKPPIKNWCHEEFLSFSDVKAPKAALAEAHNNRFFVLARANSIEEIEPLRKVPADYGQWVDVSKKDLNIRLNDYGHPFEDLRLAVRGVAGQILNAREKLIDSMLGSW
ncbi:MAG: hypothetical protein ACI8WB_003193 [Phenylobacterium sp.]|jgi:hypothetical protein